MKSKLLLGALLAGLTAPPSEAGSVTLPSGAPPVWKSECSSCHVAYPPQLLAKHGWQNVMNGLQKHFGSDASLAPADAKTILAFLERNAAPDGERFDATSGRITDTRWYGRKHHEIPSSAFRSPEVKSAANCQACHEGADKGRFSEHALTAVGRRFED